VGHQLLLLPGRLAKIKFVSEIRTLRLDPTDSRHREETIAIVVNVLHFDFRRYAVSDKSALNVMGGA